ncbi:PilW family protein [uncultured Stenotrophomonas sp.]|uniref:PilW family protein n=1 Tax=uncultured Stenotrophomonas sp. TaxID=165438 RepID=UPI0025DFDBC5|nr:prepilin-type N-terminal cleavage/methylation domain-containing protein [uncultured Stenotrophomonas sp.]
MNARHARGLTLVELLVAMILGLLVLGACLHFYLGSLRGTQDTLGVARVQEAGRLAMALIGHDIRGAGDQLCDQRHAVASLLAERQRPFWKSFDEPLVGLAAAAGAGLVDPVLGTGTALGERLPGMPALQVWTVTPLALGVREHPASDAPLAVTGKDLPDLGSPLLLCDFSRTVLMRVTATGAAIGHAAPENCVGYFAGGDACPTRTPPRASLHRFGADTALGLPQQVRWFVGNDDQGLASLYRQELVDGAVVGGGVVASGVTHFSLNYLLDGQAGYMPATSINASQWSQVRAVDVQLQLETSTGAETEASIVRRFQQTFTVRNRLP